MNRHAAINFPRIKSVSFGDVVRITHGLPNTYQAIARGLLNNIKEVSIASERLISIADNAYISRKMDVVEFMGSLLLQIPVGRNLHGAGEYYLALALKRKGKLDESAKLFESVAGGRDSMFTAKALCSIGTMLIEKNSLDESIAMNLQSIKIMGRYHQFNLSGIAESYMAIAVVKSYYGDHVHALDDLNSIYPIIRALSSSRPILHFKFLNSVAVELSELGRDIEAAKVCDLALASPYVFAYPEVLQTRLEIAEKAQCASHSVVVVPELPVENNVISLNSYKADKNHDHAISNGHAGVLDFKARKAKMGNERPKERPSQEKTYKEKRRDMLEALVDAHLTEEQIDNIMSIIKPNINKDTQQN